MTRHERTGWRDLWPSAHHRQLPKEFPRTDVDAVWSNWTEPLALVEEKHVQAKWSPGEYMVQTTLNLANGYRSETRPNGLPALVLQYDPHVSCRSQLRFTVTALNDLAARYLQPHGYVADVYPYETMSEARYIEYQAQVRGMSEQQALAAIEHVSRQPLPAPTSATVPGAVSYAPHEQQRNPWQH